jgi:hypothetical protein
MEQLLSLHYPRNYKDLAANLSYDAIFVRSLEDKQNPVEHLLQDYVTRQSSTKNSFTNVCLQLGGKMWPTGSGLIAIQSETNQRGFKLNV